MSFPITLYINIGLFIVSLAIPPCCCTGDSLFWNCSRLYNCGSLRNIGYPFYGADSVTYRPWGCGNIGLFCISNKYTLKWGYRILGIEVPFQKAIIVRNDLWDNICPKQGYVPSNRTLDNDFTYAANVRELNIFYGCTSQVESQVQVHSNVTCSIDGIKNRGVVFTDPFIEYVRGCSISTRVHVLPTAYDDLWDGKISLHEAVKRGFEVKFSSSMGACNACESSGGRCGSEYKDQFICHCREGSYPAVCPRNNGQRYGTKLACKACERSGGRCGSDSKDQFTCHCIEGPFRAVCPRNNGKRHGMKLALGIAASAMAVFTIVMCYYVYNFRKNRKRNEGQKNLEALIRLYGSLAPKRYNYSDIKKMTQSFKDKLGQGGYGGVYKGKLPGNGRPVAVKILKFYDGGDGEEFINEVASISQTSHVNVVTLLGFCLDGKKMALIYEFMPKGSLEKYIYGGSCLSWEKFYEIVIGIARGLEYLHCRCNTQILHFDIKPQNILLDDDFNPKISDFGLAKLCTKKKSKISMMGTRGTIGYIAPEVFSRCFGGVSSKSDVYSYGMMVLEIVGGRKKHCGDANRSSEVYFARWAYQRLLLDEDLKLPEVTTQDEEGIAKKMILIGLWCIQTDPSQRPQMSKVIEMLEGSLEDLEIPPKPFMCSPSPSEDENVCFRTTFTFHFVSNI